MDKLRRVFYVRFLPFCVVLAVVFSGVAAFASLAGKPSPAQQMREAAQETRDVKDLQLELTMMRILVFQMHDAILVLTQKVKDLDAKVEGLHE